MEGEPNEEKGAEKSPDRLLLDIAYGIADARKKLESIIGGGRYVSMSDMAAEAREALKDLESTESSMTALSRKLQP